MSEPQLPPGVATDDDESLAALLRSAGPRPALPVDDLDVLRATVAEAWQARRRARRRRRTTLVLAGALAASLLLALGILRWRAADASAPRPAAAATIASVVAVVGAPTIEEPGGDRVTARTGRALRAGARVSTPGSSRLALRLASGALVRLDVGSELRLLGSRSCQLARGALYADTTGAGRGALEVHTPLGIARDVGTQFAVRLVGGTEALRVQVRGGAVAVEREQRQELARAGEELTVHRDGNLVRRATPVYGPEWEWVLRAGSRFDVRGRSLLEFLDWVARETGWQVRFADPELAAAARGIAIGGSIGELPADRAAFAVLAAAGLEGELRDGTLVVRRAASPAP